MSGTNGRITSARNKPNSKLDEDEDDEWLFESIVTYLSSPIWSTPIQHFIEKYCPLFSPNDGWSGGALLTDDSEDANESTPIEHIDIHLKYKDLVDVMINTFLQDLGVTYNQFVRACKKSNKFTQHPVYMEYFEQVWCAENFKMFKAQMVRKNVELELQALVLLQHQLGLIRSNSRQDERAPVQKNHSGTSEDEIMQMVMKKSKDEYDALMNSKKSSNSSSLDLPIKKPEDLETAKKLVKSQDLVENLKHELDEQDYINSRLIKEELSNKSSSSTSSNIMDRPVSAAKKQQLNNKKYADDDDDVVQTRNTFDKMKLHDMASKLDMATNNASSAATSLVENYLSNGNISEAEIKRRTEFMQKQRDLLAEKKRVEREKQLEQFVRDSERQNGGEQLRPMSSRAARKVLNGVEPSDIAQAASSSNSTRSEEERKRLEARKALAETLKKEVINNSKK